jgi:LruC domain-containing protein
MANFTKIFAGMAIAALVATMGSCRRMVIDTGQWREIIQQNYLIDSVDQLHTWDLLKTRAIRVNVKLTDSTITRAQILSGNPYTTENVEILADRFCTNYSVVSPTFTVPATTTEFWVAAVNSQGKYYVMPVGDESSIVLGGPEVITSGVLNRPSYQTFTYLFEEDYPLPGDFDFNDVVLRISQQPKAQNILKLTVTLAAVGATKQIGAAIRLPQLNYSDVEKVTIDEGARFDEGYGVQRYFISDDEVLVEGRDGSAVINLFDDAHWCLSREVKNGQVARMYYNTRTYEVKDESTTVPTVSRTYNIYLREGLDASFYQLADIDPFIIENSSSLVVEVHTFKHKYDEAIWHYTNGPGGEDDMVPWALLVPDGDFHYPVEGMFLGRYRDGESTGAYSRWGHSFGEWGRDHTKSQDWWLYNNATKSQVY